MEPTPDIDPSNLENGQALDYSRLPPPVPQETGRRPRPDHGQAHGRQAPEPLWPPHSRQAPDPLPWRTQAPHAPEGGHWTATQARARAADPSATAPPIGHVREGLEGPPPAEPIRVPARETVRDPAHEPARETGREPAHEPGRDTGREPGREQRHAVPPVRNGFTIGPAGRAFDEVEALLGDASDPPDTMLDGGSLAGVTVLAASVRGLSHRQKGTARQDSYGLATSLDKRWLVTVVADGVSNGPLSHRAAQVTTRGATRVAALIDEGIHPSVLDWYGIFSDLAGRIVAAGAKLLDTRADPDGPAEAVARAMGTTATFLVCETTPDGPVRLVYIAWMGDSPAWSVDKGHWLCLTEIKNAGNEVASSSVAALPHLPEDPRRLPQRSGTVPAGACLFVMSDGVGDPLGDGRGEVGAVLAREWERPPALPRFAEQVAFGRKSFDDDRTVVGIWPRSGR
jgi:hypothetical protein